MIIEDWGTIAYGEAWNRQKILNENLRNHKSHDEYLIFAEHPPVFTLGFHANQQNLLVSSDILKSKNIECFRIERGGDITFHGPGQLVVYPIMDLSTHKLGVKQYVHLLEKTVIQLLDIYNIKAYTDDSAIGVWLDWGLKEARKICAIGIKISRGVSMHGLALNVNTDLDYFNLINPCGFTDKGVTSMEKELYHPVDMDDVKSKFAQIFIGLLKNPVKGV